MGWTLLYMLVILKIPLIAALILIWYAIKEEPVVDDGVDDRGGPRRKLPPWERPPRRGPRGGAGCRGAACKELAEERLPRYAPAHARRG